MCCGKVLNGMDRHPREFRREERDRGWEEKLNIGLSCQNFQIQVILSENDRPWIKKVEEII